MENKPLVTLWSKAAVDLAGDALPQLQRMVRLECSEIMDAASEWFVHVVQPDSDVDYLCTGQQQDGVWSVHVQLAEFVAMAPLPDDHPDPRSRGKVVNMPRALETTDNELFAELGPLDH